MASQDPVALLTQLLTVFAGLDNVKRREAEGVYQQTVKENGPVVLKTLCHILSTAGDETLRSSASVYIRQLVMVDSPVWDACDAGSQGQIKEVLLARFQADPNVRIRRKISQAIAQLASRRAIAADGSSGDVEAWPQLLPVVQATCQAADAAVVELGLFLLSKLVDYVGEDILGQASAFAPLVQAGLSHASSSLKVASLTACCTLLAAVDLKTNVAAATALSPLLPSLLTALGSILSEGDELPCRDSLAAMINLSQQNPGVLKTRLDDIGNALSTVCAQQDADEDTRRLGMELMTTVTEAHGGMARKSAVFVQNALVLALTMITELDDEADWSSKPYDEFNDTSGDDEQSINYTGEQALNRLAFALGGEAVFPVIMAKLPAMLSGAGAATGAGGSWQYRRAALVALGIMAEPAKKAMKAQLGDVVGTAVTMLTDGEARVRHAAIGALGNLASANRAKHAFMAKFAAALLPAMAAAVTQGAGGSGNPVRVSATAAAAIIDMCRPDSAQAKDVTPHLASLLKGTISLLQSAGQPAILVKALGCIAVVARASSDAFKTYYAELMPLVSGIIVSPPAVAGASADAIKHVQGAAMECVALMGEAVGAEAFAQDAGVILKTLVQLLQAGSTVTNDTSLRYLQDSLARIGRVLGPVAFAPYLPAVLPPLMKAATRSVDSSFKDTEAEAVQSPYSVNHTTGVVTMAVELRGVGVKQVTLNTAEMEERSHAVKLLSEYVQFMGPALAEHLAQLGAAMVPNISFWCSHTIRRTAATCYARIVGAAAAAARTQGVPAGAALASNPALTVVVTLAQNGLAPLLKVVEGESNDEARVAQSEAVGDILGALMCGGDLEVDETPEFEQASTPWFAVPLEMTVGVVRTMLGVLAKDVDSHLSLLKAVQEDADADETTLSMLDEQLEANDEVIRHCVDAMGYLIKTHRAAIMPVADAHIVPVMAKLLHSDMPDHLNFCGLCAFTDFIEWCGEAAQKYTDVMMPAVLLGIGSDYPLLRQCSLYTAGVMAVHAPGAMVRMNVLDASVKGCISVVGAADAQDEDNVDATENAVSTLGKLLLHVAPLQTSTPGAKPSAVANAAGAYWKAWMQRLPLRVDAAEAKWCNATLSTAVATGNTVMMGAGSPPSNLPIAVNVLSAALVQAGGGGGDDVVDVMDEPTAARIGAIFKQLQASAPALVTALPQAQQAAAMAAAARV